MTDGNIELVVKYKLASEDPFHSIPVSTAADFSYIVVPENNVHSIPKNTTVELNFDLTQNPIPLYAVDVYLQVVYKGTLGNETDAVAVGYKDISEPTPIDIFSNTDWICLYNNWYVAGSPEAIAQVDVNQDGIAYGANEYDVYPHDQKNIYVKVSSVSSPQAASSTNYDVKVTYLTRGNLVTPLYILSDDYQSISYQFVYSLYSSWVRVDTTNDYWGHANRLHTYYGSTIKNQTEYWTANSAEEISRAGYIPDMMSIIGDFIL
ncbi:MAG: hypothetical protein HZC48_01830 [Nitrospirae bacterium]|nr:hypothetical protein [Nitrospirota bacterium]